MKKIFESIMIIVILFSLYACDVDPYKGKRPIDYPKSTWNCNGGLLRFSILEKGNDYVGLFKTKGTLVPVRFLWSKVNSDVSVTSFGGQEELMFKGNNIFGDISFIMDIKETNGYFTEPSIRLNCIRE